MGAKNGVPGNADWTLDASGLRIRQGDSWGDLQAEKWPHKSLQVGISGDWINQGNFPKDWKAGWLTGRVRDDLPVGSDPAGSQDQQEAVLGHDLLIFDAQR